MYKYSVIEIKNILHISDREVDNLQKNYYLLSKVMKDLLENIISSLDPSKELVLSTVSEETTQRIFNLLKIKNIESIGDIDKFINLKFIIYLHSEPRCFTDSICKIIKKLINNLIIYLKNL